MASSKTKKKNPATANDSSEAPALPARSTALSRFQKFAPVRVHRSQLVIAPYNPRVISDTARQRLKKMLAKNGLVEALVWNQRTSHLVGGHQRLAILDALEGTQDYCLDVAAVDLDDKQEREINVGLNNGDAQGTWDLEKLQTLFKDDRIDSEATGFDTATLYQMFGESPLVDNPKALEELAENLRDLRERHQKIVQSLASRDDISFYTVVVFASYEDRVQFQNALGLNDNRYVDGRFLTAKLGHLGSGPDPAPEAGPT